MEEGRAYAPRWVIPGVLARAARPGRALGREVQVPRAVVDAWLAELREMGVRGIICLLEPTAFRLYPELPEGLPAYYREQGFAVAHLSLPDPARHPGGWEAVEAALEDIWHAFRELPKPVLVHCSAGRDRTGRAVAYICEKLEEKSSD